jgi:outer membrane receptor for monomeric catechols
VPVRVFTLLVNDATCGKSRGVNFYLGESLRCPNGQDWFDGEGGLELIKSLLLRGAPDKRDVFLQKVVERTADFGEVFNEALIEIGKANEASYFFKAFRDGPIDNGFNLDWVHRDSAMNDN